MLFRSAWLRLGVIYGRQRKLAESQSAFAEADRGYQQASNLEGLTELTLERGVAANRNQKHTDAAVLLRNAMERAHDIGNLHQEISAKLSLANVSYASGDGELAETLAREALAAAQANQMEPLTIRGFVNLGTAHLVKGDFAGAEQNFQEALSFALSTNSPRLAALSRLNLSSLYDRLHRSDDQIREAREGAGVFPAEPLAGTGGTWAVGLNSCREIRVVPQRAGGFRLRTYGCATPVGSRPRGEALWTASIVADITR